MSLSIFSSSSLILLLSFILFIFGKSSIIILILLLLSNFIKLFLFLILFMIFLNKIPTFLSCFLSYPLCIPITLKLSTEIIGPPDEPGTVLQS